MNIKRTRSGMCVHLYAWPKEFRKAQTARREGCTFTELSERVNATIRTLRTIQTSEQRPKTACSPPVFGLPAKTRAR